MSNAWVDFVRDWSREQGISYPCASTSLKCREDYMKKFPMPEMIFKDLVGSELPKKKYLTWLEAFKTVLKEHKMLRRRLTAADEEKFFGLAAELAFKPTVAKIMLILDLEKPDVAGFKKDLSPLLRDVGHDVNAGTSFDLVNKLLDDYGYESLERSKWPV